MIQSVEAVEFVPNAKSLPDQSEKVLTDNIISRVVEEVEKKVLELKNN